MASSKVMSSTSPANPDLPRHSSTTPTPSSNFSASNSLLTPTPHSAASCSPPSAADSHLHLHHHHQPIFSTPHQNLLHHQHHHQSHHPDVVSPFGSMNMEDIFKNIYSEPPDPLAGAESSVEGSCKNVNKMVDEVWKEIVSGGGGGEAAGTTATKEPRMTLEDFLTKAGAVSEEDVRGLPASTPVFDVEPPMMNAAAGVQFPAAPVQVVHMQNAPGSFVMEPQLGFGNAMVPAPAAGGGTIRGGGSGGGSGRGKRRAPQVEEVALDKATQQKQRRMIKNRESAARSRERKQAYTVELESLVTQLEEENARLLREEAEQKKERLKQLMESLIPVAEKPRPPRVLRRVRSMSW